MPPFKQTILLAGILLLTALPGQTHERRTPVVEAIAKAGPAVVNIRTEQVIKSRATPFFGFADPFFEQFFQDLAPPRVYRTQSLGSGVIVDPRGYILTNAHVIEKASRIFVALPDSGKELEAELIGRAERIDLAVLKITGNASSYYHLVPGRADDLLVGETVIAIGNPLGLGHSVTTGVVSAPRRRVPIQDDMFSIFIQMDALINPGNSGGPLININGELIGINTAIAKQAQGIGFAIPIDVVKRILADLIEYGKVRRPYLGVVPGNIEELSQDLGRGGVLVRKVAQDSPAAADDIRFGDVILSLDAFPVTTPSDFFSMLQTYTPGNQVELEILRGFATLRKKINLTQLPPEYGLKYSEDVFGFSVKDGLAGLTIRQVRPESAAAKVGLQPGDRITEVENFQVTDSSEYARTIEKMLGREPLTFLIVRGSRGYYLKLP